ncbi:hypothetical protein Cni_G13856 [Canna indica]|uniref:Syntaxin 6/10/61 N-terminal domain-containing protein n=1 Tax=Canna indica TaxID=4628 RepID=A0AAQ3KAB2_9LILI|nr:hypothetical protein Cni_G13856 [Canna indica]
MATCFDRWEKDPFFSAAEEVQESADRLQSVYRRWTRSTKETSVSNPVGNAEESSGELHRELQTALGTAKWQLEELEKAVRSSGDACSAGEETRTRHNQFFLAIENQILKVEKSFMQRSRNDKEAKLAWVQLDEGERDELANFLSVPALRKQEKVGEVPVVELKVEDKQFKMNEDGEGRKSDQNVDEISRLRAKEKKVKGHRRIASASADIGSWKISLYPEDAPYTSEASAGVLPPKISSFSCLMKALEPKSSITLPNGFRKWKGIDYHDEELIPLKNHQISQGISGCCEKNKGWFGCSCDEYCDKQMYGWFGAFHRQLQRSQYKIQYGRPMQIIFSVIFFLFLLVLLALVAI